MKNGFLKSAPHFFRLITRSMYALVAFLLFLAAFVHAPLQEQANPAVTPNPAKSAWFLLWIQELVSWSKLMIWPVMILAGLFLLLPWLPAGVRIYRASWFPREQRNLSVITVVIVAVIVGLTVIAMFLRGANWALAF